VAVDGTDLYVTSRSKGVIYRLDKTTGKRATFVQGQGKLVSLAVDATHVYWYSEGSAVVRRKAKAGNRAIEAVGKQVDTETIVAHASGVYWFEGGPGRTGYRLMRIAPGAQSATRIAGDLNMPSGLAIDEGWAYTSDWAGQLIVRVPTNR
jgi:sugar lactone lactonase YvrE